MSIGSQAWKRLQEFKLQELSDYYTMHQEIIGPFLQLQKEYHELGNKETTAMLNASDEIMRTHKPRKWTDAQLREQVRLIEKEIKKK